MTADPSAPQASDATPAPDTTQSADVLSGYGSSTQPPPAVAPAADLLERVTATPLSPGMRRRFTLLASRTDVDAKKADFDTAALFNGWAFLFGPLYYFRFGLWRKGLILLLLWLVPALLPDGGRALARVLAGTYSGTEVLAAATALLFPILLFSGRWLAALLTALAALIGLLYGDLHFPYLDLGVSSGFVWLISLRVWPVGASALLFYALVRKPSGLLLSIAATLLLYKLGLPLQGISLPLVAAALLRTLIGLMATRDRFRRTILRQKVWW